MSEGKGGNNIPTQEDIIKIIEDSATVVKKILSSTGYIDSLKDSVLKQRSKKFTMIKGFVSSYIGTIDNILGLLSKYTDKNNSNTLENILGWEYEKDKAGNLVLGSGNKPSERYKNVDMLGQFGKVISNISQSFDSLSKMDLGYTAMVKMKKKITRFGDMAELLLSTLIDALSSVDASKAGEELRELLGGKEVIREINHIKENKDAGENAASSSDNYSNSYKETRKGIIGIVLDLVNALQTALQIPMPGPIQRMKFQKKLQILISSLVNSVTDALKNMDSKSIKEISEKMGDKGVGMIMESIVTLVMSMESVFESLEKIKKNKIKQVFEKFSLFIISVSGLTTGDAFKDLADNYKTRQQNLEHLTGLTDTLKGSVNAANNLKLALLIFGAIPLKSKVFKSFFNLLIHFSKFLDDIGKVNIDKDVAARLEDINNAMKSVEKMAVTSLIIGLIALPAAAALFLGLIFLSALWVFLKLLTLLPETINRKGLKAFGKLMVDLSLVVFLTASALFLIALVAVEVQEYWQAILIGFGIILGVVLIALVLALIVRGLKKPIIEGLLSLLVVIGLMLAVTFVLLMIVDYAIEINSHAWEIFIFFSIVIGVTAAVLGLGIALGYIIPVVGITLLGLGMLAAIMGSLALIALSLASVVENTKQLDMKTVKKTVTDLIDTAVEIVKSFMSKDVSLWDTAKSTVFLTMIKWATNSIKKIALNFKTINDTVKGLTFATDPADLKNKDTINYKVHMLVMSANDIVSTIFNAGEDSKQQRQRVRSSRKAKKFLRQISKAVGYIEDIARGFDAIQKIKLAEDINTKVDNIVDQAINTVNHIMESVTGVNQTAKERIDNYESNKKAMKKGKKAAKKTAKYLGPVSDVIGMVGEIAESFAAINETAKDDKLAKVNDSITIIFDALTPIIEHIISKADSIEDIDDDVFENLTSFNNAISGFTEAIGEKPENIEKGTEAYIKFIDKIGKIDTTKINSTAKMFEQMAKFSESISGDFDKLADTLNDKIQPTLEELKEMLGKVPEHIDKNGANVSASVGTIGQPMTPASASAQVQRENPGISADEVNKMVDQRMSQQAQQDAASVSSKLDELIELFRTGQARVVPA